MSTAFHATYEETVEFVNSCCSEFDLRAIVLKTRPFEAVLVDAPIDLSIMPGDDRFTRLALSDRAINMNFSSWLEFYQGNPGSILLDIGLMTDQMLQASVLGFKSGDPLKISLAKKIFAKLKKMTVAGAIVVSKNTGAEGFARNHRYTKSAQEIYFKGLTMRDAHTENYYKLA